MYDQLIEGGVEASVAQKTIDTYYSQLVDGGVPEAKARKSLGITPDPDMEPTKKAFTSNFEKNKKPAVEKPKAPKTETPEAEIDLGKEEPEVADTFLEAIEAGWDMSVAGLVVQQEAPDVVMGRHPEMYMRIASGVAALAGDLPAMVVGGLAGGAAGAAAGGAAGTVTVPGIGTVAGAAAGGVVGTGAGAFALPTAIRETMMQHYEKGDIKSFSDFWARASSVFIETSKAAAIGAATVGVGGKVAKVLKGAAAPAIVQTTARVSSEVATMTTMGAALDGRVPEPYEFLDAAILIGGLHASVKMGTKLRKVYARTGVAPSQVVEAARVDPVIKQQLMAENVELPRGLKPLGESFEVKPPAHFEVSTKLPKVKGEPAPAIEAISAKIGVKTKPTLKEKALEVVGDEPFNNFYTKFVDKLDPINRVTKTLTENEGFLTADKNPYILSRMIPDAGIKAKVFFDRHTFDFKTKKPTGKGLTDILKDVENPKVLEAYMVSKRAIEKSTQGLETGFDVASAKKVVSENKAKYEVASKEVTEFSNRVLEYVKDSGVLSKESFNNMKKLNKDYVPFKRIMEASEAAGKKGKAGSLKEFKGSELSIQSPLKSTVENTMELIKLAEINRAKLSLIELSKQIKGQELIVKTPGKLRPIKISKDVVAREIKKSGGDAAHAVEFQTFIRDQKELTKNQFSVYENGKRTVYETTPELAESLNALSGDKGAQGMLFKTMRGITSFKKVAITLTPDFQLRNLFRDFLTAGAFSEGKMIGIKDVYGAMGDIVKKNDVYYKWLKSGGADTAFREVGENYIKRDIYKIQRETGFLNGVRNKMDSAMDLARVAGAISENSLRLAEFKKRLAGRKDPGSLAEAGFAAREITIDFRRIGAKMSAFNAITAFQNVAIQGMDRTIRAVKADPKGVVTKSVASMTVPSMLLWWANKDDQRVQNLPRWEKDLHWIIATDRWTDVESEDELTGLPEYLIRSVNGKTQINKGEIYRLPKPQELGLLFGTMPERLLDQFFTDNPRALKDFEDSVLDLITPSFIPDGVAPVMEQYMNKSFFTGSDIIPNHLEKVLPEDQFFEYTSETAKQLGKLVARVDRTADFASPLVIDNYLRSWGGSLGQYALQIVDKALKVSGVADTKVEATSTLKDIPFVKAFVVRYPRSDARPLQDFFDMHKENEQVMASFQIKIKRGEYDRALDDLEQAEADQNIMRLGGFKKAISAQRDFIFQVNKSPDMSPDDKRQLIDGAYYQMIEAAKLGIDLMDQLRAEMEKTKK